MDQKQVARGSWSIAKCLFCGLQGQLGEKWNTYATGSDLVHFQGNTHIKKRTKPFSMDHHKEYYDCVTALDEAFALFTIKYYTSLPTNWKCCKHATTKDDAQSGLLEEIETDGNIDQASDFRKKKSKRKDKLSGEKMTLAMEDYDAWFQKIVALCAHTKLHDSHLKQVIANNCNT